MFIVYSKKSLPDLALEQLNVYIWYKLVAVVGFIAIRSYSETNLIIGCYCHVDVFGEQISDIT